MEKQRLSNMVLINTEREYANSVVNNDIAHTIHLFGHRNGRDIILFLLACFMSSYNRFICKNIFTSLYVHHMILVSFLVFCKNLDNLLKFLGLWLTPHPRQKIAHTPMFRWLCGWNHLQF